MVGIKISHKDGSVQVNKIVEEIAVQVIISTVNIIGNNMGVEDSEQHHFNGSNI